MTKLSEEPLKKFDRTKARSDAIKQGILLFLEFIKKCSLAAIINKLQDLEMIENPTELQTDGIIKQVPVHPYNSEIKSCLYDLKDEGQIGYDPEQDEWIFIQRLSETQILVPRAKIFFPPDIKPVRDTYFDPENQNLLRTKFGIIQESPKEIRIQLVKKKDIREILAIVFAIGFLTFVSILFITGSLFRDLGMFFTFFTILLGSVLVLSILNTKYLVIKKNDRTFSVKHSLFPDPLPIPFNTIKRFDVEVVTVETKFVFFGTYGYGSICSLKVVLARGNSKKICTGPHDALQALQSYLNNKIRRYKDGLS